MIRNAFHIYPLTQDQIKANTPLSVPCPHCKADPGTYCTTPSGGMLTEIHRVRRRSFQSKSSFFLVQVTEPYGGILHLSEHYLIQRTNMGLAYRCRLPDLHDPELLFDSRGAEILGWIPSSIVASFLRQKGCDTGYLCW